MIDWGWFLDRPRNRAGDYASLKTGGGIMREGRMRDSVRLVWVGSMHRCASVHEDMTTLTKMKLNTSEQHVDLTSSCRKRDIKSMEKIISWFDTHNPFDHRWKHCDLFLLDLLLQTVIASIATMLKTWGFKCKRYWMGLLRGDIDEKKRSNSLTGVTSSRRKSG